MNGLLAGLAAVFFPSIRAAATRASVFERAAPMEQAVDDAKPVRRALMIEMGIDVSKLDADLSKLN